MGNQEEVKDAIGKEFSNKQYSEDGVLVDFFDKNVEANPDYREAVITVKKGDWYNKAFQTYKDNALSPLRAKLTKDIAEAYRNSIKNEIDLAKKEAAKEAKSKADSLLIDRSSFIEEEVRTLKATLNKDIRKAAKDSEKVAETDFIVIEKTGAEIPK